MTVHPPDPLQHRSKADAGAGRQVRLARTAAARTNLTGMRGKRFLVFIGLAGKTCLKSFIIAAAYIHLQLIRMAQGESFKKVKKFYAG
jgi:hypothetical protein